MLRVGQELYGRIFKPAEQLLKGKKRLVISLDGELYLLPLEALLVDIKKKGKETYVMDRWEVVYVSAGRDVVRWEEPATGSRAAVVMADPDYDLRPDKKIKVIDQLNMPSVAQGRPAVRGSISEDLQAEGRQVEKALSGEGYDVKLCLGEQAVEEILQSLSGPRLVHLATHGFFLAIEKPGLSEQIGEKTLGSLLREGEGWSELVGVQGEHPLLRSGIVLAGANSSLAEGRDEGIMHGIKVQGLNLWGTDLVVLSACETGLGVVQAGEGVFGLQRSFILAGARTLVASLWKVDDKATSLFMSEFYKAWAGGASKVEALANARRAVRNHPDHPEWRAPFYWAAFILSGAPD
jgi:CHAT domain-containing protein